MGRTGPAANLTVGQFYSGRLGLEVSSAEELASPHVRLTYLDAGNAYIQLVEPLDGDSQLAAWLDEHGEGLHHVCFGVDDVREAVATLSDPGAPLVLGSGRGRPSAFVTANRPRPIFARLLELYKPTGMSPVI